jgi:hypothetical protein
MLHMGYASDLLATQNVCLHEIQTLCRLTQKMVIQHKLEGF